MPYKKTYRKSRKDYRKAYGEIPASKNYNKTVYGKKYNKKPFRMVKSYGQRPWPMPTRLMCQLPYTTFGTLSSAGVTRTYGTEYVYRLNSIYDPQFALGGDTVIGHADLSGLYKKYIVHGVKIELIFRDPQADGMVCAMTYNPDETYAPLQAKTEEKVARHSQTYTTSLNNTGSQKKKMVHYVTPWALKGLSKLEWSANKTGYASDMADNPLDNLFLRIACSNSRTVEVKNILFDLKLVFYTELFDRKQAQVSN